MVAIYTILLSTKMSLRTNTWNMSLLDAKSSSSANEFHLEFADQPPCEDVTNVLIYERNFNYLDLDLMCFNLDLSGKSTQHKHKYSIET